MKKSVLLAILVASLCCAGGFARADDAADVRKAFDTFVQYTKTDDEHTPDLFASDIAATFFYDAGQGIREMTLQSDTFRQMVKEGIAKKDGNSDTYEDVQCTQDGDTVKLTATRIDGKTGVRAPFTLIYAKDDSGTFKIKAMRMQVPPPKVSSSK